jgi:hypothetical protein
VNLAKTFRWRPNGPVMDFFRREVVGDYYAGGFDGEDEVLMLVHGEIAAGQAASFVERLQRVGQSFAAQHQGDQKLATSQKRAYTLVLGMRRWLFAPFRDLQRDVSRRR